MFLFYLFTSLLVVFSHLHLASSQPACTAPYYYTTSTTYSCSSTNYIAGSTLTNIPTSTKALTVVALLSIDSKTDSGCAGLTYPVSVFTLSLKSGGSDITIMDLKRTTLTKFEYYLMGTSYSYQDIGGLYDVFTVGGLLEVKMAVDLANNKANMATTYWGDLNYNAPLPSPVSFPNSAWTFDANTKFWFGGGPSATKRYKVTVAKMTVWNGYLPLVTVGANSYPGEILLGHSPVLVANYKLQDLGSYSVADAGTAGTAYLGASTAGSPSGTNAPGWVSHAPMLQFSGTNQYFAVPRFPIAMPNSMVKGSLSVSFWIQPGSQSSTRYIFRYATSGAGTDRFAIKITSSLELQMCASSSCQTAFSVSALSTSTWTLITANWAFRTTTTSNINCYYSVYANGQLVKPEFISALPSSVISYATNDVVRFGGPNGFVGKLAAIKIYSPGSLQANLGTWCTSTTCGADIGATNPPTCLMPSASACHSSCSKCADTTDTGCVVCATGRYFSSGKCVACPAGSYLNGASCSNCISNCAVCSDGTTCTTCSPSYSKVGGLCIMCPTNCDVCSTSSICTTCSSGFKKYNNQCYATCPVTSYANTGTTCASCPSNCDTCSGTSTCTTCSSGFKKYNNQCYATCPATTYANTGTTCANCPSNCDTCSDGSTCTACTSGFKKYNNQCYGTCPVTTYANSGTTCANCPSNCDTCSDGSTCTTCTSGFKKYNNQCYASCPVTSYANSGTTCASCSDTASLRVKKYSNQCYGTCPVTTYANTGTTCANCPSNCDTCSDGSTCTACSSGFKKYNNQCYVTCPVTTYANTATTCASCPSNCDYCSDGSTCTTCSSGWSSSGSGCVNSCPATTYASGSNCLACPSNCDTCSSGGTICTVCSSGSYLHSGACGGSCPLTTYISGSNCLACPSNCDTCSSGGTICTVCSSGFKKYNNQCYATCPVTTYANSGTTCASCSGNCDTCSDGSTCTACSSGWFLHNNGCVNSCPATTFDSGSTCLACLSNCDTCSSSGTVCTVCTSGFKKYNNQCYGTCPVTTYANSGTTCAICPSNCDTCSDGSTCTACSSGFKKYNNQCYATCPVTTYANSGTTCASCSGHCDTCSDASTCTTCSSGGYYLHNNACTNTCPATTFPSGSVCGACPSNCNACSDGSTCTGCSLGWRLFNTQCYNPCPFTTYPATTSTCSSCESNCKTCSDSTTCTLCSSGFFLYQQDCYGSCPLTTFTAGTNCQDCSSNCEVCSDANTCNLCSTSSYLYSNKCYGSCPVTTFTSGTNCLDCGSHCDTCIDGNTCTACTSGSYSYLQKCYGNCPSQAPYISPTVAPYVCYQTCPTATPYSYQYQCYVKCPDEAPYVSDSVCSSKNPNSAEEIAKIGNTVGSAANTALVVRNLASFSNPMPFMFGSLMKLLQYTRYQNVSHSERLEVLFQTISDAPDLIPKPSMSNEMQGAFESHPLPYVFEKYEMSSNFMLNEGNDILGILTYLAIFVSLWVMQKGIFYLRNLPMMRSFVIKARFFFQNYLLSEFYEMLGDVSFSAVLELKTLKVHDRYSRLSLTACLVCMFLGAILYLLNIWIVYSYQKKKAKRNHLDGGGAEESKKFSEKYEGVEILFSDFDDRSFVHQAALIFFVGRNIIFCAIIALMYSMPLFQSVLLLILDLCLVVYYLWKRSIKNRMDYTEQLTYELILLVVNLCFVIQAVSDSLGSSSATLIHNIGEIVIVLNTICKFLPLVFLGIKLGFALWEYYGLLKQILNTEALKKKKKKRTIRKMTKQFSNNTNDSSFMASFQTSAKGLNSSFQERSSPILNPALNIETMRHLELGASAAQINLLRSRNARKSSIVPIRFEREEAMSSYRTALNVSSLRRIAEGKRVTEGTEEVSMKRKIRTLKKNLGPRVGPDLL